MMAVMWLVAGMVAVAPLAGVWMAVRWARRNRLKYNGWFAQTEELAMSLD